MLSSASTCRIAAAASGCAIVAPSLPSAPAVPALAAASTAGCSASAAFFSASISAKDAWHSSRKCARTLSDGTESSCRHVERRSAESRSIRCSAGRALPSRSIAIRMAITSAVTRLAIRASGTCSRERSASLVSAVPVTAARKKSPPTISSRSLSPGVPPSAPAPAPAPLLPAPVCGALPATDVDAYVPSASTVVRTDAVRAGLPSASELSAAAAPASPSAISGSEPSAPLTVWKARATSSAEWQNSPSSQSVMRSTRDEWTEGKTSSALEMTDGRSCACTSTISRTKRATSSALDWCWSERKSISTGTTVSATSGNLTAHAWIAWMSSSLYSAEPAAVDSSSELFERETSFFSACTTSPMFRGVMRSSVMSRHFLRMSRLGLANARITSITISCSTRGCFTLSSCRRSSTMSLTLWSLSAVRSVV
mmetsp:Transcript_10832/g.28115  ORF Transcript_10832/g.28115 Transcript_10832/m.28115 type:complete len:426 (-) Transcript_10832:892-2169(-)